MSTETTAYPLSWPAGWTRTEPRDRGRSRFTRRGNATDYGYRPQRQITIAEGCDDIMRELDRMGATEVILSTNLRLRQDELPYSNQKEPEDPGVAVYFTWDGEQRSVACDSWDRVADNLRAVAKSLEALRGLERWGASQILKAAFTGFAQLPENAGEGMNMPAWWDVLGVDRRATREDVESAFKRLAKEAHPDRRREDTEAPPWHILQAAYDQGKAATA